MQKIFAIILITIITSGCSELVNQKIGNRDLASNPYEIEFQPLKTRRASPPLDCDENSDGADIAYINKDEEASLLHSKTRQNENTDPASEEIQSYLDQALDFYQASQDFWQQGEQENAIQALDQSYALILNVNAPDDPKQFQQKEDLRFMIAKRIREIYASRNTVVNGAHNAIPLTINEDVQSEIKRFTTIERDFFVKSLKRSGRYRPQITQALHDAGLPEELSWLPLVESGFKIRALSKARALGLWQFIPSTGYKFGLKRDEFIDERLDPEKSTQAAIAYLTELHKIFGDWATVLAAYNCGEGRVLKIIRSQNVNYLDNFWDLYGRLPRETARYVPRFIATLHIVNNPEKYGFDMSDLDPPMTYKTVEVSRQIHLQSIAERLDTPAQILYDLNSQLRYKITPSYSFNLKVPTSHSENLLSLIQDINETQLPQKRYTFHRVRRGESLSTIARKYRSNINVIARANNIRTSNIIVAGTILKIPHKGYTIARSKPRTYGAHSSSKTHIVKRGDSLWIIARKYGTTTQTLQTLNNLLTTDLHIGQVLKLPEYFEENTTKKDTCIAVYKVKRGDSPFSIARQHNMNLDKLLRLNQLSSHSTIYPGQELYIE